LPVVYQKDFYNDSLACIRKAPDSCISQFTSDFIGNLGSNGFHNFKEACKEANRQKEKK